MARFVNRAVLGGGQLPPAEPATIDNTPSNSSLLPTQVAGAHDLYVAREAAMDDLDDRITALENA